MSVLLRPEIAAGAAAAASAGGGTGGGGGVRDGCGLDGRSALAQRSADRRRAKTGGILVESKTEARRLAFAVVGIGINVHQRDFDPELVDAGNFAGSSKRGARDQPPGAARCPARIAGARDGWAARSGCGVRRFRRAWRRLRRGFAGGSVEVHGPQACTGVTAGLDENGFLLVRTDDGIGDRADGRHSRRERAEILGRTMLLALDVGNTNTVLGLYRLDAEAELPPKGAAVAAKDRFDLTAHWRVTTHRTQTVDEYGVLFVNLFEMHGMSPSQVTHIIISSVVPPVESTLRQVCETYFHLEPLFVEPGIKTGMPVLVDNPTELGADRLADCIAAIRTLWRTVHRGGLRHGDEV